jgi:antitoxin component YwqK of YwqJK toxin-antitoxin module
MNKISRSTTFTITFFTLIFILPSDVRAQEEGKVKHTIQYQDSVVQIEVMSKSIPVRNAHNLVYSWYANKTIHFSEADFTGSLLDGVYICTYTNTNLCEKGHFKKGLKTGLWLRWYPSGKLCSTTHWKNGLLHGGTELFNEKGEKTGEFKYCNGQLDQHVTKTERVKVTENHK